MGTFVWGSGRRARRWAARGRHRAAAAAGAEHPRFSGKKLKQAEGEGVLCLSSRIKENINNYFSLYFFFLHLYIHFSLLFAFFPPRQGICCTASSSLPRKRTPDPLSVSLFLFPSAPQTGRITKFELRIRLSPEIPAQLESRGGSASSGSVQLCPKIDPPTICIGQRSPSGGRILGGTCTFHSVLFTPDFYFSTCTVRNQPY